jgi:guanylate kinase
MVAVQKGKLIIFSAPSGSGKTTLVKHLMSVNKKLSFSISAASRKMRSIEVDGEDYYFISVDEFKAKIKNNEFVEWEEVYPDHFYGTLYSEVERIRNKGRHVVFDVDVFGGLNIKKIFKDEALAIFVKPPSLEDLKNRLIQRATEDQDKIKIRLDKAEKELAYEHKFDIVIINDDLEFAKKETINHVNQFIQATL